MIDSHAHLTDSRVFTEIERVRSDYLNANIKKVVDVGCSLASSKKVFENAKKYLEVYFTAGCHPDAAGEVDDSAINELKTLLASEKCIAVGEIGLDYHYLDFSKSVQLNAFERQLDLAVEVNMPAVIHSREACKDTIDVLSSYSHRLNGFIMHCYSESKETAKILLDKGAYFSFGGVITFKNAKKADIVKSIPLDRVLFETDCPYMAPVPHRGEMNEPKFVKLVYEKASEIYEVSVETLIEKCRENFTRLFKK